jgi:hypothetical protein
VLPDDDRRSKHVGAFNCFNASFGINTIHSSAFVGFNNW